MQFVTVATRSSPHFEACCARVGLEVTTLGLGGDYPGHGAKIHYLLDFLEGLPEGELVCYCDAYDVLWLRNPRGFEETFAALGQQMVISCEQYFYHQTWDKLWCRLRYPLCKGRFARYRYLNAGCFAGYAGPLRRILGQLGVERHTRCDQIPLTRLFLSGQEAIGLDYNQQLFGATGGREGYEELDFALEGGEVVNRHTGERPYLLHFPGKNVVGYNRVLKALGWDLQPLPEGPEDHLRYERDRRRNYTAERLGIDNYSLGLGERAALWGGLALLAVGWWKRR